MYLLRILSRLKHALEVDFKVHLLIRIISTLESTSKFIFTPERISRLPSALESTCKHRFFSRFFAEIFPRPLIAVISYVPISHVSHVYVSFIITLFVASKLPNYRKQLFSFQVFFFGLMSSD